MFPVTPTIMENPRNGFEEFNVVESKAEIKTVRPYFWEVRFGDISIDHADN